MDNDIHEQLRPLPRLFFVTLTTVLFFCSSVDAATPPVSSEAAAPQAQVFDPGREAGAKMASGEIIIKMRGTPGTPSVLAPEELSRFGLQGPLRTTSGGESIYRLKPVALEQLRTSEAIDARILDIVKQLNASPDVEYAQPNWLYYPLQQPGKPGINQ